MAKEEIAERYLTEPYFLTVVSRIGLSVCGNWKGGTDILIF